MGSASSSAPVTTSSSNASFVFGIHYGDPDTYGIVIILFVRALAPNIRSATFLEMPPILISLDGNT